MLRTPRSRPLALLAAPLLLLCGSPSCAVPEAGARLWPGGGDVVFETAEEQEIAYWAAVGELELGHATRIAPGPEHADFARGMRLVVDGRMDEAEERFAPLAAEAADSLLRTASRVALTSIFGYDGRWQALHDLATAPPVREVSTDQGRAGIEAWSAAMRMARGAEYRISNTPALLPFQVTGTGTPLVPVHVNGRLRYFWLDTGTSLTLLASDVAAEAGLRPLTGDTLEIVTTVGRIQALPAVVDTLLLGPLQAVGHPAAIVPARELTILEATEPGRFERVKIDGVIGMDLLRRLNVVIDFPTGVAILGRPRPDRDPGRRRNLFWLGYPVVRAEGPRGTTLYFGLDTGADSTFVTRNLLRKLPSRLLAKRTRYLAGFGGDTLLRTPVLSGLSLRAAGKSFILREVMVHENRRLMLFELDGILAADLGAGHRVRIDMTNGIFEIGTPGSDPRARERKPGEPVSTDPFAEPGRRARSGVP
ncbi:MAG TPA: retropepsin-like aspartic protease [Longimicrobiaceae bacterium]|nr:retropepsin-like aspartic protease [Longimicrobiaceae bacterium]